MRSNISAIQLCIDAIKSYGISNVVISPGSRNAPFFVEFENNAQFNVKLELDERSAGFKALGMAKLLGQPVALVCTSGSAVLNYAPALSEAYYSNIPLVVLSADRPKRLVGQGEGQTIKQLGSISNVCCDSISIEETENPDELMFLNRRLNDILHNGTVKQTKPVHINIHLDEPLYSKTDSRKFSFKKYDWLNEYCNDSQVNDLYELINSSKKVLVIVGALDKKLANSMIELFQKIEAEKKWVILKETSSNLGQIGLGGIDKLLSGFNNSKAYEPDLVITLGKNIISKMLKQWLRKLSAKHIHIGSEEFFMDPYGLLSYQIKGTGRETLEVTYSNSSAGKQYAQTWSELNENQQKKQTQFEENITFSDYLVHKNLSTELNPNDIVLFGNSTIIRYAQFFKNFYDFDSYELRGVSGIEGLLSTSIGIANSTTKNVWCIIGDLSLVYDFNALIGSELPSNLKLIVINNSGGDIFRFIKGPEIFQDPAKSMVFEGDVLSNNHFNFLNDCYVRIEDQKEIAPILKQIKSKDGFQIVEFKTPIANNSKTLKRFFSKLKETK